jgi:hypothetical protein
MKSLISFYHIFKVRNRLDEVTLEVCELLYKPGMKAPKDFQYDVAQGTLVEPASLYDKLNSLEINKVVPHSGLKNELKLPTRRYK